MSKIQLSEIIKLNRNFQNSINIQLDLNRHDKILNYIPTKSSLSILNRYIDNFYNNTKEKSTLLIGPYGKGKSHLLLVLLGILSLPYEKKSNDILRQLIKNISEIDNELADKINSLREQKSRYLPVIISNSYVDLNQSFLIALINSLKSNGLSQLIPDTFYGEAIKTINRWKEEYPDTYKKLTECLEEKHVTCDQLIFNLKNFDKKSYEKFTEIYPQLTSGSIFNPLLNMDIISVYKTVSETLKRDSGYDGIIIIFDEFSKFIEGHQAETISYDMKIVQDMCELANSSTKEPIHIVFVAHKSIKEYGAALSHEIINSFMGVKGRLTEILFISSVRNTYELIRYAIQKDEQKVNDLIESNNLYRESADKIYEFLNFKSLFTKVDYDNIVVRGCFPLSPLSSYMLLNISEKVAQNERTLFTFISKNEPNSLARFINNNQDPDKCIMSADWIYDYFKMLFKEELTNPLIHNEWLKAEYAISQVKSDNEIKLIKILALINILNRPNECMANDSTLGYASTLTLGQYTEAKEKLIEKNLIAYRKRNNSYVFKNNVGVDIEKEIRRVQLERKDSISRCDILLDIAENKYTYPKVYNQTYKITRYYRFLFMECDVFLKLPKVEYLFEEKFSDGKIIKVFCNTEEDFVCIKEKYLNLRDNRIIIMAAKAPKHLDEKIGRLLAVRSLKGDEDFLSNNKVLAEELEIYDEDICYEINSKIDSVFNCNNNSCQILCLEKVYEKLTEIDYNRLLGTVFENYYRSAPVINNEMINRRLLSNTTKRARRIIIENLLSGVAMDYSGTSQEATIFRSVFLHTGIWENKAINGLSLEWKGVFEEIDTYIDLCGGSRQPFSIIYEKLQGKRYGMRLGVIAFYLVYKIKQMQDSPIIYFKNQEVELNADLFDNIDAEPQEYSLFIEEASIQKEHYLNEIEKIFFDYQIFSNGNDSRLYKIVKSIERWYRSLPQFAMVFKTDIAMKYDKKIVQQINQFRKLFQQRDMNPHETLFEKIPKIFECGEDYSQCLYEIKNIKGILDGYIKRAKECAITVAKIKFGINTDTDLRQGLYEWRLKQSKIADTYLYSNKVSSFMNYLNSLNTYDELDIVNRLSQIVLDIYIEDWNDESLEKFSNSIKTLKEEIERLSCESIDETGQKTISFVTSNGNTITRRYDNANLEDSDCYYFKNDLIGILEEYNTSLEIGQKVSVIVEVLEKLLKS